MAASAAEQRGPALESRRLRLRPADRDDVPFLHELVTASETGWRWRYRGAVPSREDVGTDFVREQFVVLVIDDKKSRTRIGFVHAYAANMHDGHAAIGIVITPARVATGWGAEAMAFFINYLFCVWPFRKLYAEVPEFNFPQFASGTGRDFSLEGRAKAHHYYDGKYWDRYTLAFYRDEWLALHRPTISKLRA